MARGTPELVLVSGYSGIGKSSVVNELHKAIVLPHGIFISGKFDQYKRDIPYATLAQAFETLVRQILSKNEAEVERWRDAIRDAVGPNGQLIVNLVPEVELVIGKQPPVADLPPQDAQNRFQMVFRRFLGVFARKEHPLALFLDDLQWLDRATLDLLEHLVMHSEVRHLLLVGAYRDNEVGPAHPLWRTLEVIRKAGARVQEIVLAPLGLDDVGRLVADALHCEAERAWPLAQLVQEKTEGNPFFAIQFFMALAEEGLLAFDLAAGAWTWDVARIQAKRYTDNVVDLMAGKLNRLPASTQEALQKLACLGNLAEIDTITLVHGGSEAAIHAALWLAVRQQLLERLADSYRFVHDRIQEAAYSLIPEELRGEAHLRIGRLLAAHIPPEKREEAIFDIVNQLNRGAALITSQEEREQLAELNLIAGQRAKASAAYASALTYFVAGAALLAQDSWERRHDLTFALELHRAECEFLTGEFGAAEEWLDVLSARTVTTSERASVACLRAELYTTLDRSDRAIGVGLEYLQGLGIEWSPHPSEQEVRREYECIWRQLGSRTIEELIDLPLMSDPVSLGTLDVLTKIMPSAFFTDANLLSLAICRAVNLSLQYGNSDGSCFAYAMLVMIAGPYFGNYQAGFRFGKLGFDLVEKRGLDRFKARVYMSFGAIVNPWGRHVRTGLAWVRRAFIIAQETGDFTFSAYSSQCLITQLLAAGDPLIEVEREAEDGLQFAQKARFGFVMDWITPQLGLIRTLRGLTPKFGSFDDGSFNEVRFERHFSSNPAFAMAECWYWIRKLQARFFAGEYASALEASLNAQQLLWSSTSCFETAEYHFYSALSRAASCDSVSASERQQHLETLAVHHRQLRVWAENCPTNFETRAALVAAEIARLESRVLDAEVLYEQAIRSAHENGFVHNEALDYELAARFYAARGFEDIAHLYLRNARYGYLRWGADGKVQQLDEMYPHLRTEEPAPGPTSTIGAPLQHLDLATVIKVSQAVSGEIVLEKLIETLLKTAVEHAGAERGLLILPQGEQYRIEAEITTSPDQVEVQLRQAPVTSSELPESLLRYVIRTQEKVILDDASVQNLFSEDEYLCQRRSRSILCLPLVKQARLMGVLYLENNLAPRVFTPKRLAMLELLASQASISLDNARLYAGLAQENSDRRRAEEALRESEQRMALATHGANLGIWIRDFARNEIWASDKWRELFGFSPSQRLEFECILQRLHPDDRESIRQALAKALGGEGTYETEYRVVLPDGRMRWIASRGGVEFDATGKPVLMRGASLDITTRKQAEEAARDLSGRLIYAQEAERMRLARDLHDDLSQSLALLSVELEMFGQRPPAELGRISAQMQEFSAQVKRLSADVHRLSHELHPAKLKQLGLVAALRGFCKEFAVAHEMAIEFADRSVPRAVPEHAALCLYRIAQEALHNVVKHSGGTAARIELAIEGSELRLAIADDGVGFDPERMRVNGSLGLVSMGERARCVHGLLSVESHAGKGTRVEVRVPIAVADNLS